MPAYTGPVFDAHHHLWEDRPGARPWLDRPGMEGLRAGGTAQLHGALFGAQFGQALAGTVWIEALAADPEAELAEAEAQRLASRGRLCSALVAHAPLDAPDIGARLDRLQAISPALRGIRDIVAHEPGQPSVARAPDLLHRPAFLDGLKALERRGLVFDLMLRPGQMADASHLLDNVPDLTVVIEHCGSPHDRSPQGIATWREGIARLAARPGCHVKVSALHCLFDRPTDRDLAQVLEPLRQEFGPERMAFGTDWPVHDRHCPAPEALATLGRLTAGWSGHAQRNLFHDTARRLHGV